MSNLPPGYVRRPWTKDEKRAASERNARRLGAKPGHRIVYSVQVPIEMHRFIQFEAARFRNYGIDKLHKKKLKKRPTLKETRKYVRKLKEDWTDEFIRAAANRECAEG